MAGKVEGFTCCWWDLTALGNVTLDVTLGAVRYEVSGSLIPGSGNV